MIDDLAHITFPNSYTEHGLDYHDRADDFPWIPINACKTVTGSPLLLACVRGCADVIQFLLDHGANADARAADGSTPLSILQAFKHTKEAQILVSATLGLEAGQRRGTPIKMRAQHVGIQLEDTPHLRCVQNLQRAVQARGQKLAPRCVRSKRVGCNV